MVHRVDGPLCHRKPPSIMATLDMLRVPGTNDGTSIVFDPLSSTTSRPSFSLQQASSAPTHLKFVRLKLPLLMTASLSFRPILDPPAD